MLIYWILFAIPVTAALIVHPRQVPGFPTQGQALVALLFALFYLILSLVRYEVGSDWYAYEGMYSTVAGEPLSGAFSVTDPLFSLLLWLAAQLDAGIYPVNAICSAILVVGVIRVAVMTREPWLALTASVPYLLIVVGFGYVRQAAAIGVLLMAIGSLDRRRPLRTLMLVLLASGFHSTAIVLFPIFGFAMANRNKLAVLSLLSVSVMLFLVFAARQFQNFSELYFEAQYSSSGALVRILMGFIPAVVLLLRWSAVDSPYRVRMMWLGLALANVAALVALAITPSSTVIDRMALYFSAVQIFVFGEIMTLLGLSARHAPLIRLLVIAVSVAVMLVWLNFATHAGDWVPYETVWQRT